MYSSNQISYFFILYETIVCVYFDLHVILNFKLTLRVVMCIYYNISSSPATQYNMFKLYFLKKSISKLQ